MKPTDVIPFPNLCAEAIEVKSLDGYDVELFYLGISLGIHVMDVDKDGNPRYTRKSTTANQISAGDRVLS